MKQEQATRDDLLREYEMLPSLIAHWDSHFWSKSTFFFAVESLALGAGAYSVKDSLLHGSSIATPTYIFLSSLTLLSLFVCYVWFRTNRSSRRYLHPLLERARGIERTLNSTLPHRDLMVHRDINQRPALSPDNTNVFSYQWDQLLRARRTRVGSSIWEMHLPTAFSIAWLGALVLVSLHSWPAPFWIPTSFLILLVECLRRHQEAEQSGTAD